MRPEIETLNRLASCPIDLSILPALRKALIGVRELQGQLDPRADDDDTIEEFEGACTLLDEAMSDLDTACADLEAAADKDEIDDAIEQIQQDLDESISSLNALMEIAEVDPVSYSAREEEFRTALNSILGLPKNEIQAALIGWLEDPIPFRLFKARNQVIAQQLAGMRPVS